ncbi:protein kinase domain-containing protein [Methylophaga thalassica]|nr:protein kinase [Methylophaga aminisulfidivorans]
MSKKIRYKKNQLVGDWRLESKLGVGGNGEVWSATHIAKSSGAIKLLKNIRSVVYDRFRSEVEAIEKNQDIVGVIPLIDSFLPEDISSQVPWYVMPKALKFTDWRDGKSILQIVEGMLELAKTIHELHQRKFHHRDIKPANILFLNDRLYISDFGLVKYPDRLDITPEKSDVGPKYTMAPEMRRYAHQADGEAADIYSFAKTLWIAIVGDMQCFDGQYSPLSVISINSVCTGLYTKSLNELLAECTDNSPELRPRMKDVINRIEDWIRINNDFHQQNLTEWFDLQNRLFPAGMPESVTWTNSENIITVLNEIGKTKSLNHTFLPGGGGNTFIGAEHAKEVGMIAIKISDSIYDYIKPRKLTFESFGLNPKWNYFRLEVEDIELTDVYDGKRSFTCYEELVELQANKYAQRYHWDIHEYQGEPLTEDARLVCRYFSGCFVIFSTRSPYNLDPTTYDGRHNKMTEQAFRDYIFRNASRS